MKKIKVGVIGVGYLGRIHAAKYAAMDDVELVGVSDTNESAARDVANKLSCRPFTDYKEMLDLVDAVSVVTHTKQHFKVADHCLEQGVDVLVEKPMTTTTDEADRLISRAESCQRILQVGHIEQFNPAILAMEQYLTTPVFIEAQRLHSFKPRGTDVDVVLDLMIHDLDIILGIVDSPLASIHSVGAPLVTANSDIANCRLIFENGCTANVTASRISRQNTRKMRIFQPDSYITVDFGNKEFSIITNKGERHKDGQPVEEVTSFSFPEKDALATEIKAFILNVRQRTTPKIGGRQGRQALRTALMIIEQIKSHREEHPDLFG